MHKERCYYLFPFELVGAGEKIIIYGCGRVGQWFLSQVQASHYANVIAIADKACDRYSDFNIPLIAPGDISKYHFDKIVIAIEDKTSAHDVLEMLVNEYHIDIHKIIWSECYRKLVPEIKMPSPIVESKHTLAYQLPDAISVAVWIGGGLGDNIIFKRKLDEIMKLHDRLCIDLYTESCCEALIQGIYGDDAYNGRLNAILGYGVQFYESKKKSYVFALCRAIDISLDWLDGCRWPLDAQELYDCLQTLDQRMDDHSCWQTTEMAIHYALCTKKGLNAYTSANRRGGVQVCDFHTYIPLHPVFKKIYEALHFKRYITINIGFDQTAKAKKLQTKCWSINNFAELVRLIKNGYPDIEVLQTDGENISKILGCDKYFMGENIELIKYILNGSLLHISIEGGLVHLASQLDTKCIVLFGPTPIEYYGYANNINIQAGTCHNCLWLEPNNHYKCSRNLVTPECMELISPNLVYDAVQDYLDNSL